MYVFEGGFSRIQHLGIGFIVMAGKVSKIHRSYVEKSTNSNEYYTNYETPTLKSLSEDTYVGGTFSWGTFSEDAFEGFMVVSGDGDVFDAFHSKFFDFHRGQNWEDTFSSLSNFTLSFNPSRSLIPFQDFY